MISFNNDIAREAAAPAYRIAARRLKEMILRREIAVGAVLPSEVEMARMLDVNRSTVREAIRLVEENGLVGRKPGGKKLFVTVPTRSDVSGAITTAMLMQDISVSELFNAMQLMEPAIAATAADQATDRQIERLEENIRATRQNIQDRKHLLELDIEYHHLLSEASGNRAMLLCRDPLGVLFYPAFNAVFQRLNVGERLLFAHETVLNAVKNRDAKTAEEWMKKHIVDFGRGIELANLDMNTPISELDITEFENVAGQ